MPAAPGREAGRGSQLFYDEFLSTATLGLQRPAAKLGEDRNRQVWDRMSESDRQRPAAKLGEDRNAVNRLNMS